MSSIMTMVKRFLTDKAIRHSYLVRMGLYKHVSDETFLRHKFRMKMGYALDLNNPRTFNEKMQWLKLYDRKPEYTTMVDKAAVKDYVAERIGREYIVPTLGVWDRFEDIDFDALPDQFVLKCTHDSGGIVICRDKAALDRNAAAKKIRSCLSRDYYLHGREWPYKNVKRRILAEAFMEDPDGDLRDYKFFCFNGEPRCVLVCAERGSKDGVKMSFFDTDWNLMPLKRKHPQIDKEVPKPETLSDMLSKARILAQGIPFVRVDFYEIRGKVYFGEMTFFPASGFGSFEPAQWDETLGQWITLPK